MLSNVRDKVRPTHRSNDLHLSRSRDINDHVTIRFGIFNFLKVVLWNRASIYNVYQGICIQIYLDHDFELSCPRHVIVHVTI